MTEGKNPQLEYVRRLEKEVLQLRHAIRATIGWQQSTDPENVESVRLLLELPEPEIDWQHRAEVAEQHAIDGWECVRKCREELLPLRSKLADVDHQNPIYQLMEDGNWYDAAPHVYYEETAAGNIGRIVYARYATASQAEQKLLPLPQRWKARKGQQLNGDSQTVMIPDDSGVWVSLFDVEHLLRRAGVAFEEK